jgi:hypothetical protein
MRKLHFVLMFLTLAIIATPIGASCQMTPFMGQIQLERTAWIPIASGAIELTHGGVYRFSIWRNPGDCLLVAFHGKISTENHPVIHGLLGSNGNNWLITDTQISDMWVTVLTTFVHSANFRKEHNIFKREHLAAEEVIKEMGKLGRVTNKEFIH